MKFRTGLVIGFASGYVLGAKAGRERYEQLKRWFDSFTANDTVQKLGGKGKSVIDLTTDRMRGAMSDGFGTASRKIRDAAGS